MEITIHNVAERAGVSVSTASRILNGGTKGMRRDAAERARKVLKAAEELGYQPNTTARGLVLKRSFTLGFLATELSNPVRAQLVEKLREAALEKGYHLLVSGVQYGEELTKALTNLTSRQIDGLILGNIQNQKIKKYTDSMLKNLPVISFGQDTDEPWDTVVIDYPGMITKLTTHLITDHGYQYIAFAGINTESLRRNGYIQAMKQANLENKIEYWPAGPFSLEGGRFLAQKMIESGSRPQAVVCHNDLLAIGIMDGLRKTGIRVPEDIAVVGLDNIDMADYTNPALTSVGVDSSELADKLFELLLERIENKFTGSPRKEHCNEKIFIRESCGCKHH